VRLTLISGRDKARGHENGRVKTEICNKDVRADCFGAEIGRIRFLNMYFLH